LPLLPGRIEEVLDTKERFRSLRFVWLAYRTNTVQGTLAAIRRWTDQLQRDQVQKEKVSDVFKLRQFFD